MSANKNSFAEDKSVKVETLTLDDGRRAERHIALDESGNEIVEIFAEEKRPLKLEKRIVREYRNVVSKEIHETIKDGEVAYQEVRSVEPEVPLQIRSRVGLADHHKVVDGDYVRKDEIDKLIADGVVAGVTALMDRMEPTQNTAQPVVVQQTPNPVIKVQEVVEKSVEDKKKNETVVNIVIGVIIVAQVVFFSYMFLI